VTTHVRFGAFSEVGPLGSEVSFTTANGHRPPDRSGPKGARSGHHPHASDGWTAWHSHPFAGKSDSISALNFDTPSRTTWGLVYAAAEIRYESWRCDNNVAARSAQVSAGGASVWSPPPPRRTMREARAGHYRR